MLSINPSEVIWTILCFFALLFVLDRLLYRPLVRFMDERKARVDAGLNEEAAARAAIEEEERDLEREREERLQEAKDELRAEKDRSEERRVEALREAKQLAAETAEQGKNEAAALREQTDRELQLRRDELAGRLAERLLNVGNTKQ